jgi:hypothetical protein
VPARGLAAATPEAYEALLALLHQLQERTLAMARARLPVASSLASRGVDGAGASDTPNAQDKPVEQAGTAAVSSAPAGDDPDA